MRKINLLTIFCLIITQLSLAQGSIDIDTNIQMGVVGTEHVKITSSAFSVHNGTGSTPLIYGDFGSGNVGIGTDVLTSRLSVNGRISIDTNNDAPLSFNNTDNSWQYLEFKKSGVRKTYVGLTSGNDFEIGKEEGGSIVLNSDHLNVTTPSGYVTIGSLNSSWAHFQTDRPKFYFNKEVVVDGGIGSYSGQLKVNTPYGYVLMGPGNTGWAHFSTDRQSFYFGNAVTFGTGEIASYSTSHLYLKTGRTTSYTGATRVTIINSNGYVGVGLQNPSQRLSVNGNASKSSSGSWVANSDARLKKEIIQLNSEQILEKLLQLKGVTYEWDDEKTGIDRPEGIQYGFTAQNIQEVFPSMVTEDNMGYLQSAYGNYDAMLIEAIRALNDKLVKENDELRGLNKEVKIQNEELRSEIETKVDLLQFQIDQIINKYETRHSVPITIGSGNLSGSKQ